MTTLFGVSSSDFTYMTHFLNNQIKYYNKSNVFVQINLWAQIELSKNFFYRKQGNFCGVYIFLKWKSFSFFLSGPTQKDQAQRIRIPSLFCLFLNWATLRSVTKYSCLGALEDPDSDYIKGGIARGMPFVSNRKTKVKRLDCQTALAGKRESGEELEKKRGYKMNLSWPFGQGHEK